MTICNCYSNANMDANIKSCIHPSIHGLKVKFLFHSNMSMFGKITFVEGHIYYKNRMTQPNHIL